ncbi:MAG: hypothetical protein WC272_11635 [Sulfurimonas sp.]
MKKSYISYAAVVSLVALLSGCGGSTPQVATKTNYATLDIFNQKLLLPKEQSDANILKKKLFKANYERKDYTYSVDKKNRILKTNDYEMLNFNEYIYVKNITFIYDECQNKNVVNSASNALAFIATSPFMLLGATTKTIEFPYKTLKVQDYALNESLESDNDSILGCDFEFKYSGFTDHLKVNFEAVARSIYVDEDTLDHRSVGNHYDVSYLDTQAIFNIIEYNLKNRQDVTLNEKLVGEISQLPDLEMFTTLKQNRKLYKLPKYSLLDLPFDADLVFMANSGYEMIQNGFYKVKNGDKKAIFTPQENLANTSEVIANKNKTMETLTKTRDKPTILKSIELIKKEKQEALAIEAKLKEQEKIKQGQESKKQAKIEKNFAKKSEIQEVAKKETSVKVDEKGVDFFNTLKDDNARPISIE